ncbi:unnamed protein product [Arabidopsis thaliana]|uniref:Uncharacterized protein F18L15.30 n=2 Tax=Arabidopsis thaliana TaxID=3702 RepID=Q9SNA5_ARATH|nr:uncharacterized protein AT3G46310 [Arabidopsis thaliana]AEE78145.1 hypothetical protein AT3G46310 [Arabidopsis thaliana]CAB62022.1 hypothetical protein [Arabidopsis thaliana]VYS59520.1 unnamed protein product [Arabidopsis thaliana]|eukprot:NP_190216.1 hypothetical protein AT3G46310 [Arabidopsis thaliana]
MASKCIGDCVNIKNNAICVRPGRTHAKIHKWPMAEVEFVQSISQDGSPRRTTAVESLSCRQMYLRSYTFSRKEENEDGGGGAGRKKLAKKDMRTSKRASLKGFVVRFTWKCLSCTCPNKFDLKQ